MKNIINKEYFRKNKSLSLYKNNTRKVAKGLSIVLVSLMLLNNPSIAKAFKVSNAPTLEYNINEDTTRDEFWEQVVLKEDYPIKLEIINYNGSYYLYFITKEKDGEYYMHKDFFGHDTVADEKREGIFGLDMYIIYSPNIVGQADINVNGENLTYNDFLKFYKQVLNSNIELNNQIITVLPAPSVEQRIKNQNQKTII